MKLSILQTSIIASVFIVVVIIIRALLLHKIPKTTFIVLWLAAIARLLIPFSVPAPFSVYNNIVFFNTMHSTKNIPGTPHYSFNTFTGTTIPENTQNNNAPANLLFYLWLAGMLIIMAYFIIISVKNRRLLRFSLPVEHNSYITQWLKKQKPMRKISFRSCDRIYTPVTTGILRPKIILPASMDTSNATLLDYVLTHEYLHIRRLDSMWKILSATALCIHWFNPLVWVLFILFSRDLEITCDMYVLRHFGEQSKVSYAYSIIHMAQSKSNFAPLYSGFSKNAAEERIEAIMKTKKITAIGIILSALLILCATSVFAAGPYTTNETPPPPNSSLGASGRPATEQEMSELAGIEKEWADFGIIFTEFECTYNGQPVDFFVDSRGSSILNFSGSVSDHGRDACAQPGSLLIETVRDKNGKLVDVKEITPERADKIAKWRG